MTARTYVLIFFFWAILTVITPTLIILSENSRLVFADATDEISHFMIRLRLAGEKREEIKTRKMMGHSEEDSMKTLMALVKMQAVAAPAPAPGASVGIPPKREEQQDSNRKQAGMMYKDIVAQLLFEV